MWNNSSEENEDHGDAICMLSPVNEELSMDIRYILYGPTLFFIIIFGILGNILTFLIFLQRFGAGRKERQQLQQQQRMRIRVPKMHKYLAVLSIWDLMLITSSFFLYNLPYLMYGRVRMYGTYVRIYPYAYALACASRTGGIWILIASAVDRYFAVCHPFTHYVYSTDKKTKLVLTVCCVLSFLYGWPRYYHIILEDCYDLSMDRMTTVALGSDLRANPVYWYGYKIAADFILVSVGPFVILLYLSLAVGLAVKKSSRSRKTLWKANIERADSSVGLRTRRSSPVPSGQGMADQPTPEENGRLDTIITSIRRHEGSIRRRGYQETQNSLNFMLITVLAKFLVCHSLPAVLDVCETTMDPHAFQAPFMDDLVHAANALVIVNCSVNIVLYLICSRRFRFGVTQALFEGMKRQRRRSSAGSSQSTTQRELR